MNIQKGVIYLVEFGCFKLWRTETFKTVDLGNSYMPKKKAFFTTGLIADLKQKEFLAWNSPDKF